MIELLNNTWHNFEEQDLIKITQIKQSTSILELYHGPTAAFKDFGLQLAAAFFNKLFKHKIKQLLFLEQHQEIQAQQPSMLVKISKSLKVLY